MGVAGIRKNGSPIKVTDTDDHCFFVHFDRASQDVVKVDEYRTVYRPWMTNCAVRTKAAISAPF